MLLLSLQAVVLNEHDSFLQEMEYLARQVSLISACIFSLRPIIFFALFRYRHENIVQILGVCIEREHLAYIMERMEKGSLMEHLHVVLTSLAYFNLWLNLFRTLVYT